MKTTSSPTQKAWIPTRWPGLYRNGKSGIYYQRFGRRTWKTLKTKTQSVALKRREELLKREGDREAGERSAASMGLKGTLVSDLIALRMEQLGNSPELKENTKGFWGNIYASLCQSWPELRERDITSISQEECERWAGDYSKKVSPSLFTHSLTALRKLFEICCSGFGKAVLPNRRMPSF